MKGKIPHTIIFIVVAGVVITSLVKFDPEDDATMAALLPALMLGGLYLGFLFVMYILPAISQRAVTAVLSSNEDAGPNPLHDAQAAHARGDYPAAVEIYRELANEEPLNRLHWIEIAKIQRDQMKHPEAAIHTLRTALENKEWADDDVAFFMGRLAEIHHEDMEDTEQSAAVLNEIIKRFPESRYSVGAEHKLKEIGYS